MTDEADAPPAVEFHLLGPLHVLVDGVEVPIATRRQRALLVLLLLNVGRVVSADRLIEELWDGAPPPQATITLRSYVSNLRQALGGRDGLGGTLVTRGQGYALDVPPETVDAVRLRRLSEEGRRHLREQDPYSALSAFEAAVRTWTGAPLQEVADHEAVQSTITQLTETYLGAVEGRLEALIEIGRHRDALPDLEALVRDHPLREQPRALLMLALYRDGRAADALEAHRFFRDLLNDELGIDPSARLGRLTQQILNQDPALEPAAPAGPTLSDRHDRGSVAGDAGSAIVGRARELTRLRSHLDRLEDGSGSLVLIAGEPGIGKSTMLDAIEADAASRDIAVHRGRALSSPGTPAFWPWIQIVDSIAGSLDDDALQVACAGAARPIAQLSPVVAERIGQTVPLLGDSAHALRFRLYEAVSTFVRNVSGSAPLVVTLDDLQGADLPSLELLSYLTPTLSGRPLLLAGAYRNLPSERTPELEATLATVSREDAVDELTMAGLSRDDVDTLMIGLVGRMADEEARHALVDVLHQRTGGNPFFVRQLARTALESADPTDLSDLAVPPGVSHVIASRLAGTSEPVRDLLCAAAVLGRDFDAITAAAISGLSVEHGLDLLDEAAAHGLVEPDPQGGPHRRFAHALVREVVLQQLPAGRTARLHAAAAAELERVGSPSPPSVLAEHLWQARGIVGADAIEPQLTAADAAAVVYAHEQVEVHLRRALELTRMFRQTDPDLELEILLRLYGLIATDRGWGDEDAEAVVVRATTLLESGAFTDRTARSWWGLFFFLLDRDDRPRYVEVATRLLEAIGSEDSERPTAGRAGLGSVHLMNIFSSLATDDREAAHAHLRSAHDLITDAPASEVAAFDENLLVMLYLIEGYWAALSGDVDQHRTATELSLALADADGRPFPRAVSRTLAAVSAAYLGAERFAQDLVAQALDLGHRFGFSWLTTLAECVDGWANRTPDSASAAAQTVDDAIRATVTAGRHANKSFMLLLLADLQVTQGDRDLARTTLEMARETPGPYQGLMVEVIERRLAPLNR